MQANEQIVLTGDRPTGCLHIGHYVGSLITRLSLEKTYKQFIMIADMQALTDNAENTSVVKENVIELALDYLAIGLDPIKNTIFIQSMIPALTEITSYYLNLVTVARLQRNPTVKSEMYQKGYGDKQYEIPAGFLIYPISQAADITAFNATIVPAGADQIPIIEQTNDVIKKFNSLYGNTIKPVEILLSNTNRLIGLDGKAKMSKSLKNAIYMSDNVDLLRKKVMSMFTDQNHININDKGDVTNNPVFLYLDAFGSDKPYIATLKQQYSDGGLADSVVKNYLFDVLEKIITPIYNKRLEFAKDKGEIMNMLKTSSIYASNIASATLERIKSAIGLKYQ